MGILHHVVVGEGDSWITLSVMVLSLLQKWFRKSICSPTTVHQKLYWRFIDDWNALLGSVGAYFLHM